MPPDRGRRTDSINAHGSYPRNAELHLRERKKRFPLSSLTGTKSAESAGTNSVCDCGTENWPASFSRSLGLGSDGSGETESSNHQCLCDVFGLLYDQGRFTELTQITARILEAFQHEYGRRSSPSVLVNGEGIPNSTGNPPDLTDEAWNAFNHELAEDLTERTYSALRRSNNDEQDSISRSGPDIENGFPLFPQPLVPPRGRTLAATDPVAYIETLRFFRDWLLTRCRDRSIRGASANTTAFLLRCRHWSVCAKLALGGPSSLDAKGISDLIITRKVGTGAISDHEDGGAPHHQSGEAMIVDSTQGGTDGPGPAYTVLRVNTFSDDSMTVMVALLEFLLADTSTAKSLLTHLTAICRRSSFIPIRPYTPSPSLIRAHLPLWAHLAHRVLHSTPSTRPLHLIDPDGDARLVRAVKSAADWARGDSLPVANEGEAGVLAVLENALQCLRQRMKQGSDLSALAVRRILTLATLTRCAVEALRRPLLPKEVTSLRLSEIAATRESVMRCVESVVALHGGGENMEASSSFETTGQSRGLDSLPAYPSTPEGEATVSVAAQVIGIAVLLSNIAPLSDSDLPRLSRCVISIQSTLETLDNQSPADWSWAWLAVGLAAYRGGIFESAAASFERCSHSRGSDALRAAGLGMLGISRCRMGLPKMALIPLHTSVRLHTPTTTLLFNICLALRNAGDISAERDALAVLARLALQDPTAVAKEGVPVGRVFLRLSRMEATAPMEEDVALDSDDVGLPQSWTRGRESIEAGQWCVKRAAEEGTPARGDITERELLVVWAKLMAHAATNPAVAREVRQRLAQECLDALEKFTKEGIFDPELAIPVARALASARVALERTRNLLERCVDFFEAVNIWVLLTEERKRQTIIGRGTLGTAEARDDVVAMWKTAKRARVFVDGLWREENKVFAVDSSFPPQQSLE
ncbi:hypothetical protein HDU93_003194 [Gonapodya sp. JEL0774]|nr:hypothetical protein HDU93_003194 [Gonapodya sp. JEL0774]